MTNLMLRSLHLKNFKAISNSGNIKVGPLTVFIGNNGSGKSSVIEGLRTLQTLVAEGLDEAMYLWRGFEHVRNHKAKPRRKPREVELINKDDELRVFLSDPISFVIRTSIGRVEVQINESPGGNELFIQYERVRLASRKYDLERDGRGATRFLTVPGGQPVARQSLPDELVSFYHRRPDGQSIIHSDPALREFILNWQFLMLNPESMGEPKPQRRTGGPVKLNSDGSNIAEYLLSIRNVDLYAFNGIIETLQYVLPYAEDLQPALTSELERNVYLQLTERDFKIPGWLLSTGTLRILALLAVLRHPTPPPLLLVEEIENGLDPRTIHLLVEEMQSAVKSGMTQIIFTTHSPYLLDLLPLSSIVLVERKDGEPTFTRPADQEMLQAWAEKFRPGQLYTMNRLISRGAK